MNQEECRITVSVENENIVVNYWDSNGSNISDQRICINLLTLKTIERMHQWAATETTNCTQEDLKVLGLHLYYLLFNEVIREKFDELFANSKVRIGSSFNLGLRLTIVFHKSAKELSLFPWEFIFMPKEADSFEGEFLAKYTELMLTRYLDGTKILEKLTPEDMPIKILIVSSHPKRSNGKRLEIIEDDSFINKLLNLKSDNIKIAHLPDPNSVLLQSFIEGNKIKMEDGTEIQGFAPHILHFIGHGEAGKIALKKTRKDIISEDPTIEPDTADDAEWVDGSGISALFGIVLKPKFVFLNACNVARIHYKGFSEFSNNIALDLIKANVPAVLAMQYEIRNDDASLFAEKIYTDIINGLPIDQAVKNGIRILGNRTPAWNHPRFGIPVFYLGAKDTTFFSVGTIKEKDKVESVITPLQIQCPTCDSKFARRFKVCPKCGAAYTFCINKTCLEPLPIGSAICPSCSTSQKEEITDAAKSAELIGSRQNENSKSSERELREINKNKLDPSLSPMWALPNKN